MPTIFTKIISGEIPCYKVYEDEHTFAFLSIKPNNPGHTLVIPKIEVDYFVDVPEPYYSAVFQTAKKIAPAIQRATQCKRIGTSIAGFDVPHFHYHLIPAESGADLDHSRAHEIPEEEMKSVQEKIMQEIEKLK